jgi:hypothetical protein
MAGLVPADGATSATPGTALWRPTAALLGFAARMIAIERYL